MTARDRVAIRDLARQVRLLEETVGDLRRAIVRRDAEAAARGPFEQSGLSYCVYSDLRARMGLP